MAYFSHDFPNAYVTQVCGIYVKKYIGMIKLQTFSKAAGGETLGSIAGHEGLGRILRVRHRIPSFQFPSDREMKALQKHAEALSDDYLYLFHMCILNFKWTILEKQCPHREKPFWCLPTTVLAQELQGQGYGAADNKKVCA